MAKNGDVEGQTSLGGSVAHQLKASSFATQGDKWKCRKPLASREHRPFLLEKSPFMWGVVNDNPQYRRWIIEENSNPPLKRSTHTSRRQSRRASQESPSATGDSKSSSATWLKKRAEKFSSTPGVVLPPKGPEAKKLRCRALFQSDSGFIGQQVHDNISDVCSVLSSPASISSSSGPQYRNTGMTEQASGETNTGSAFPSTGTVCNPGQSNEMLSLTEQSRTLTEQRSQPAPVEKSFQTPCCLVGIARLFVGLLGWGQDLSL